MCGATLSNFSIISNLNSSSLKLLIGLTLNAQMKRYLFCYHHVLLLLLLLCYLIFLSAHVRCRQVSSPILAKLFSFINLAVHKIVEDPPLDEINSKYIYKVEQFSQNLRRKLSASRMRRDAPGILPRSLGIGFLAYSHSGK